MIVVLVDEGTLGQIVALPAPHNHIPQGRNRPLPNTAAVKQWFRDLVRTHCRTIGAELEPQATPNPPLAENVMIFHQLKADEVQAVLSVLEVRTAWSAELLRVTCLAWGVAAGGSLCMGVEFHRLLPCRLEGPH